jgi:hypothetical protein
LELLGFLLFERLFPPDIGGVLLGDRDPGNPHHPLEIGHGGVRRLRRTADWAGGRLLGSDAAGRTAGRGVEQVAGDGRRLPGELRLNGEARRLRIDTGESDGGAVAEGWG